MHYTTAQLVSINIVYLGPARWPGYSVNWMRSLQEAEYRCELGGTMAS